MKPSPEFRSAFGGTERRVRKLPDAPMRPYGRAARVSQDTPGVSPGKFQSSTIGTPAGGLPLRDEIFSNSVVETVAIGK